MVSAPGFTSKFRKVDLELRGDKLVISRKINCEKANEQHTDKSFSAKDTKMTQMMKMFVYDMEYFLRIKF